MTVADTRNQSWRGARLARGLVKGVKCLKMRRWERKEDGAAFR